MLTGLAAVFFYIFAFILIMSAVMVIFARNPVHSVLFLILAFFNAAALFLLSGAEFLAMILLVVYVGAVAVLFLFVVMMLDIDFIALKQGVRRHALLGITIGVIFLAELLAMFNLAIFPKTSVALHVSPPQAGTETNIENSVALGNILYTDYVFYFELAGLILLVAMIGAIILTLRHKIGVKRQSIAEQVARQPKDAIEVRDVESGKGI